MTGAAFRYFAFGSNLSSKRIRLDNPSARAIGVGLLRGYRLSFNGRSKHWKGSAATIEQEENSEVYGVLWELDMEHLTTLDRQEGVSEGIYRRFEVDVACPNESKHVKAYTYQMQAHNYLGLDENPRPSAVYKSVILAGAREHGLPEHYIKVLEGMDDNGYNGEVDVNIPTELRQ